MSPEDSSRSRAAAGEANETIVSTEPFGSTNVFVAKYDGSGGLLWVRAATGPFAAVGRAVAADAGGNSYVTGDFTDSAGATSLTFGRGEPNETTLTTESAGEIFVAKYANDDSEPANRSPSPMRATTRRLPSARPSRWMAAARATRTSIR